MRPALRAAMPGSTAWCMCSAPVRLMAISLSHCGRLGLGEGLEDVPAGVVDQHVESARSACCAPATAASTLARSVMSHDEGLRLAALGRRMAAATFSAASRFRSNTATLAPSLAKRRQVAPPMPPPPPVTTTVLPSKRLMRSSGLYADLESVMETLPFTDNISSYFTGRRRLVKGARNARKRKNRARS